MERTKKAASPVQNKKNTWRWRIAQYFELKWWQHYLKGRDKKSYQAWKKAYWKRLLAGLETPLPVEKSRHILDAGCGPAGIFMVLDQCRVTAIDPLLFHYQERLSSFQPADYPHTRFFKKSIETFHSEQLFDIIFCMNALNHVADIRRSVKVLHEQLKTGGYMVLSIDAHNHGFFKYFFRLLPGDILHPHQYDLKEYRSLLQERDLRLVETKRLKSTFLFDHYVLVLKK